MPDLSVLTGRLKRRHGQQELKEVRLVLATRRARNVFGGAAVETVCPFLVGHALGVTAMIIARASRWPSANIIDESSIKAEHGDELSNYVPDAAVIEAGRKISVALEYGGDYGVERLAAMHPSVCRRRHRLGGVVMSSRVLIMDALFRYDGGLVSTLVAVTGLTTKNVERVLAFLIRDGEVRAYPFLGRRKFYAPTAQAARKRELDARKYERSPGGQAMVERLARIFFCRQTGFEMIPREEFAADFAAQAEVPGVSHSRYYADATGETSRLCVLLFDFGCGVSKLVRRCRREIQQRKGHQAFKPLIYPNLFQVTVVTAFEAKAVRLRAALAAESFPNDVVVVPDIENLLLPGE